MGEVGRQGAVWCEWQPVKRHAKAIRLWGLMLHWARYETRKWCKGMRHGSGVMQSEWALVKRPGIGGTLVKTEARRWNASRAALQSGALQRVGTAHIVRDYGFQVTRACAMPGHLHALLCATAPLTT